ncbi:PilN domain-containing protein [Bradyrhizobium sp. CB3481]|uniref:PilN domain-containing protein n=1 Tax=Bradyrhizobium sp. CB3481 TaxID=3039158 RepID=UPI0024B097DA|nr:PilN domain-containing protein [Bradyrhizobium sp. CB3481]WFU18763.1 PilN domain-containing protein [Bradyrhizobium sp. CB3481]
MPVANLPARAGGLHVLNAWGQGFAQWWLSGLRDAVPAGWRVWAEGETRPQVTLWRDGDGVTCRLKSGSGPAEIRIPVSHFNAGALEQWFTGQGVTREGTNVAPVISHELFFLRELSVPKAAIAALPKILEQDIVRRTPFQLSDIWHAATAVGEEAGGVVPMCHWIIRRDRVEAALSELGLTSGDVDCLAVAGADGEALPVITFRTVRDEDPAWALRAVRLLAAGALAAVLLGLTAFEWRQASVADALETALAEVRQSAQNGRDGMDPAARLFAMKAETGVLAVWDELSRILPDHTFLTETRIADGTVTLSGFSADAAGLVRIIDQSPLFSGATLTSAITPDANERKDRFSLAFKLRGARSARPAARSRTAP